MGLRGPPPTPSKVLEMRGSRLAKKRTGEPKPPAVKPSCPKWLGKEARAEWRRQVKHLERLGLIAQLDRAMLAAYCEAWGEFVAAAQQVAVEGSTCKSPEGGIYQHPAVSIRNKAFERLAKCAQQFGFSPSSRARLHAPGEPEKEETSKSRFFRTSR